jgi:hypothetical protein
MLKHMSQKQLVANQRNAQQSTGPRTPAGKAVAKLNALKHGILSTQVLVRGRHLKESQRELTELHQRFVEELKPVGPVEEMLVDKILTAHWRLRRALTAESGEIALSVDGGQWQRSHGQRPGVQWAIWTALGDPIHGMSESTLGNQILGYVLGQVRQAVERDGELTEAAVLDLVANLGGHPNRLATELEALRLRLPPQFGGADSAVRQGSPPEEVFTYLDRELRAASWREAECAKREAAEEQARQAATVLPSAAVLDKILRYETKLERQLERAMNQLERLQRRRLGEAVPPPVAVEVSDRG